MESKLHYADEINAVDSDDHCLLRAAVHDIWGIARQIPLTRLASIKEIWTRVLVGWKRGPARHVAISQNWSTQRRRGPHPHVGVELVGICREDRDRKPVFLLKRFSIHLDTLLYDGGAGMMDCCRRSEMTPPL